MRGMEIVERLMHFNLTRHEATLYLLLVKAGRLTGYEAAKQTLKATQKLSASCKTPYLMPKRAFMYRQMPP